MDQFIISLIKEGALTSKLHGLRAIKREGTKLFYTRGLWFYWFDMKTQKYEAAVGDHKSGEYDSLKLAIEEAKCLFDRECLNSVFDQYGGNL